MSTQAELITLLKSSVDDIAVDIEETLENLLESAAGADAAAANALAAAETYINPSRQVSVYLDAVNGDDTAAGTKATPIKTWAELISRAESGQFFEINLMSDVVADHLTLWRIAPSLIRIIGRLDGGTGLQNRKITFVDAANFTAAYSGGFYCFSSMNIGTDHIDFEIANTRSFSPVYVRQGRMELLAEDGTITRTGSGGPLFNVQGSAHFQVASIAIDASASGHVVKGVAAGADPNAIPGYSSNFTQA